MRRVLLGTFAGFLVTLVIGLPLGILLPFIGILIGMLAGGFVAGGYCVVRWLDYWQVWLLH
jgi:hypothetical protein